MSTEQVEAFGALPIEPHPAGIWHCSRCGGTDTVATQASLDPRYAIGRCRDCSRSRISSKKGHPPETLNGDVDLVLDTVWDEAKHRRQRRDKHGELRYAP